MSLGFASSDIGVGGMASANAQRPSVRRSERRRLADDSLFAEFRSYQERIGFVSEPMLDGEDLQDLLKRLSVLQGDAEQAATLVAEAYANQSIRSGTRVRVKFGDDDLTVFQLMAGGVPRRLDAMEVLISPDELLSVVRVGNAFELTNRRVSLTTRYVATAGEISRALSTAAANAGIPTELMLRFADVFAFDVDFARQIYRGDRFELVYEVLYDQDGNVIDTGEIVFAALTWRGQQEKKGYYRFMPLGEDEPRYFSADGRNPRTLLMRSPINGARVTSRFGRRRHPVLGFASGHKGVDFGAASGTPIMAAGDGVVEIAGPRGTYGNYVRIQHTGGYQTAYAHMRGFAPGMAPGTPVKQGQVIGYVGTTGRSTGPHLHYEVLRDGEFLNPETVSVAVGQSLEGEVLQAFSEERQRFDSLRIRPFAVPGSTLP
ncbi:MAG: M23 family metallopeptidase [Pseudomonadota bacterium]